LSQSGARGGGLILATTLPSAAAICVFGTLYGAGASSLLGAELTLGSSLLIFSGSLQFALSALVSAGASTPALLLTAGTLNMRHLVLGAVLRPRIGGSRLRRAALAFFLLDETFGLAVAAGDSAEREGRDAGKATERTLLVSGVTCYVAWQAGTVIGLMGAALPAAAGLAAAIFPVLFIGLSSLACRSRSDAARALAAAGLTVLLALAVPGARALAPVVVGLLVALPRGKP
jgi:predicted branched-subunit amino acid permease